ncbi:MAG: hypothetical protein K2Y33_03290 [Mycolicibacterium frederiksbergense]|nr:hypothetical protein [Mycolicibacterium frederiksbergense]
MSDRSIALTPKAETALLVDDAAAATLACAEAATKGLLLGDWDDYATAYARLQTVMTDAYHHRIAVLAGASTELDYYGDER